MLIRLEIDFYQEQSDLKKLTLIIIFFSVMLGAISCNNDIADPPEELSRTLESENFKYFMAEGDYIDTLWQEQYHEWLLDALDVTLNKKLIYKKYRNRKHLKEITGRNTNGFAEIDTPTFHTIWLADNHESVHAVVLQRVGHPPALFNEGIAVAHTADYLSFPEIKLVWNGDDFHTLSKEYNRAGLLSLNDLLESTSFFDFDTNITYPVAGSFTRYLINEYGIQKVKDFISISDFYDTRETTRANFESVYSVSIDEKWNDWLSFVENY